MLEYLVPLKNIVDIVNGMLQAKKSISSEKVLFDEVVTPVYQNLSKVVTDYLSIFTALQTGLKSDDFEPHVNEFRQNRLALLTIRREVHATCLAVLRRDPEAKSDTFRKFFVEADHIFCPAPYDHSMSARIEYLLRDETEFWEGNRSTFIQALDTVLEYVNDYWQRVSEEYADLNLRFKAQALR